MDSVLDIDTVTLGQRVCRRPEHWRNGKWRDDRRMPGTVIGYTDANGELHGLNSGSKYDTDRITDGSGPGWAVVAWDATGLSSVYPIGAMGPLGDWWALRGGGPCHSLRVCGD